MSPQARPKTRFGLAALACATLLLSSTATSAAENAPPTPDPERARRMAAIEAEINRQNQVSSPIVEVGSRYANAGGKSKYVTEDGSGVVMELRTVKNLEHPAPGGKAVTSQAETIVMTNAHMIDGEEPWVLVEGKRVPAEVLVRDAETDLAFLRVKGLQIEPAYIITDPHPLEDRIQIEPAWRLDYRLGCLMSASGSAADSMDDGHRRDCSRSAVGDRDRLTAIPFIRYGDDIGFSSRMDLRDSGNTPDNRPRQAMAEILSPSWASPGAQGGSFIPGSHSDSGVFSSNESQTLGTQSNVVHALSPGGNSGSLAETRLQFIGLPNSYSFFFARTQLTGVPAIRSLFALYREGKKKSANSTRWKMRNGLLYQDFGDGTIDLDVTRQTSGRGIAEPAGRDTSAPPGGTTAPPGGTTAPPGGTTAPPGGTTAPPGGTTAPPGGTTAPPGQPCANSDEVFNLELLRLKDGVFDAAAALQASSRGADPGAVTNALGVTAFMSRNGKRVYGFEVRESDGSRFILYPDSESYIWLRKHSHPQTKDGSGYRPLFEPPGALELLQTKIDSQLRAQARKLRSDSPAPVAPFNSGGSLEGRPYTSPLYNSFPIDPENPQYWPLSRGVEIANLGYQGSASIDSFIDPDSHQPRLRIRWKLIDLKEIDPALRYSTDKGLDHTRRPRSCALPSSSYQLRDQLEVILDEKGRLAGRKYFEPIIRVRSEKGDAYYLDLRPLLYTDMAVVYPSATTINITPGETPERAQARRMALELRKIPKFDGQGRQVSEGEERALEFDALAAPSTDGSLRCDSSE